MPISEPDPHQLLDRLGLEPAELRPGPAGTYRWGEHMLSEAQALRLLGSTRTWEELREGFVGYASEPGYHLEPSRVDFLDLLPVEPSSVLDVGCGLGLTSEEIARRGHTVVGVDRSAFRAAFTRARLERQDLHGTAAVADLNDVSAAPGSFDAAVMLGVLEWLAHDRPGDPEAIQVAGLRQVADALRPGGRLLLVIENRYGWPFLLGRPEVHVGRRFIGVVPRALTRLWRTEQPFRIYTHTLRHLEAMAAPAGLTVRAAFGALPQYHRPTTYVPLRWRGLPVDRSRIVEGYEAFAERHEGRRSAAALVQLHRALPARVAEAIAPGYVIELEKGSTGDSILEVLSAGPPIVHIGGGGAGGAATVECRDADGRRSSFAKLVRRSGGADATAARVARAHGLVPGLVVPRHEVVEQRGRTVVQIEPVGEQALPVGSYPRSLGVLGALHRATAGAQQTVAALAPEAGEAWARAGGVAPVDPTAPVETALTHGDWILRNLRESNGRVAAIDWDLGSDTGSIWADALWGVVRTAEVSPEVIETYAAAVGSRPTVADAAVTASIVERRLTGTPRLQPSFDRLRETVSRFGIR